MVSNKEEFEEEVTTEQREKWVKANSHRDTESKDVLNSKQVCGKNFVSGKPAPYRQKNAMDWLPTLVYCSCQLIFLGGTILNDNSDKIKHVQSLLGIVRKLVIGCSNYTFSQAG